MNPLPDIWSARPPFELNLSLGDPWTIVLPRIYRYMEQEHVDAFFETGALRLASMARFAEHPDEPRRDQEGQSVNSAVFHDPDSPTGGSTIFTVTATGQSDYILCGSIVESERLLEAFGVDGCFAIENPIGFAQAVKRFIPGCIGGLQGPCFYSPRGAVLDRRLDTDPIAMMDAARDQDGNVDMGVLPTFAQMTGGTEQLFLKQSKFDYQAEYRMIWRTQNAVDGYIDVVCPEAVQFCAKVTGAEEPGSGT
jgi:hypothetical protein